MLSDQLESTSEILNYRYHPALILKIWFSWSIWRQMTCRLLWFLKNNDNRLNLYRPLRCRVIASGLYKAYVYCGSLFSLTWCSHSFYFYLLRCFRWAIIRCTTSLCLSARHHQRSLIYTLLPLEPSCLENDCFPHRPWSGHCKACKTSAHVLVNKHGSGTHKILSSLRLYSAHKSKSLNSFSKHN